MWPWRRRPQRAPVLTPSLDRLAELVDRVIALLDGLTPVESGVPDLPAPAPVVDGWVALVPASGGYGLRSGAGPLPPRGHLLELEVGTFRVLRYGPSPLPGDPRRCLVVEREEPAVRERTCDG